MRFIHPSVLEEVEALPSVTLPSFTLPPGISIIKLSYTAPAYGLPKPWFVALYDERWSAYEDPPFRPVVQVFGTSFEDAFDRACAKLPIADREFREAYERKHRRLEEDATRPARPAKPAPPTSAETDDLLRSIGLA